MVDHMKDAEVRQAVSELQGYLSDMVAPLMVADVVEFLLEYPPEIGASAIQGWVSSQYRGQAADIPLSDYYFHAVKKIHVVGELELVGREVLAQYVAGLGQIVIELCPEEERASLKANLDCLGQSETALTPTVEVIHRQAMAVGGGTSARAAGPAASKEIAKGLRRFSVLLERLERERHAGGGPAEGEGGEGTPGGATPASKAARHGELLAQLLATAAMSSRSGEELDEHMKRLAALGVDAHTDEMFRTLGKSLPGWAVAWTGQGALEGAGPSRPIEAMRRIIAMAEDPREGARRFNEMVQSAIERFNAGALPQAVAMFDLAEQVVVEQRLDSELVRSIRGRAHEALAPERLREFADRPERHAMLARVLSFFPTLRPDALLGALTGEERRERRRLLLQLIEAHAVEAYPEVLTRLAACVDGDFPDPNGYFQRNLVYLLRRIPRPEEADADREVAFLDRLSGIDTPALVIKEALGALGQAPAERAEKLLIARMREFEERLEAESTGSHSSEDIITFLDRTASALAGLGTPNAWRTVVNHALKTDPRFGDSIRRLSELSDQDLGVDKELLDHLLGVLEKQLPRKVLGIVMQTRKAEAVIHLIEALSGTPAPPVRQAFERIVERFSDHEFGQAASRALAAFGSRARPSAEAPSAGLSGDLELFGLPNVFQTLADAGMTGALSLFRPDGGTLGTLAFQSGKIRDGKAGHLSGEMAIYQLFERPSPGTFLFRSQAETQDPAKEAGGRLLEVVPMMLEAMRRHDELQEARALVPDDATLCQGAKRPTRPPEESDKDLLRSIWTRAAGGTVPSAIELEIPADSYRIRKVLAHWVEEGSLDLT